MPSFTARRHWRISRCCRILTATSIVDPMTNTIEISFQLLCFEGEFRSIGLRQSTVDRSMSSNKNESRMARALLDEYSQNGRTEPLIRFYSGRRFSQPRRRIEWMTRDADLQCPDVFFLSSLDDLQDYRRTEEKASRSLVLNTFCSTTRDKSPENNDWEAGDYESDLTDNVSIYDWSRGFIEEKKIRFIEFCFSLSPKVSLLRVISSPIDISSSRKQLKKRTVDRRGRDSEDDTCRCLSQREKCLFSDWNTILVLLDSPIDIRRRLDLFSTIRELSVWRHEDKNLRPVEICLRHWARRRRNDRCNRENEEQHRCSHNRGRINQNEILSAIDDKWQPMHNHVEVWPRRYSWSPSIQCELNHRDKVLDRECLPISRGTIFGDEIVQEEILLSISVWMIVRLTDVLSERAKGTERCPRHWRVERRWCTMDNEHRMSKWSSRECKQQWRTKNERLRQSKLIDRRRRTCRCTRRHEGSSSTRDCVSIPRWLDRQEGNQWWDSSQRKENER